MGFHGKGEAYSVTRGAWAMRSLAVPQKNIFDDLKKVLAFCLWNPLKYSHGQ